MKYRAYRSFREHPEQTALKPATSGNAINGLGERQRRRPTPIYWHAPDTLEWGALQRWFYTRDPDNPLIREARRERARWEAMSVPPPAGAPVQRSPRDWTRSLEKRAAGLDLELVGVTAVREEWIFEGHSVPHRNVVMIGVAHDYEAIRKAPGDEAAAEVIRQYGRGIRAAKEIATWLREQGWEAEPHGGPMAGPLLLIPPAIECGFGELGKHGSIINRDYGSSFRLACVTTDAPFEPTGRRDYGVDDYCQRCQACVNACPTVAIAKEKQWVRGEYRWYVDFDRCLPFFNEHKGCAICLAVCPWSIPGRGERLVDQLMRDERSGRRD